MNYNRITQSLNTSAGMFLPGAIVADQEYTQRVGIESLFTPAHKTGLFSSGRRPLWLQITFLLAMAWLSLFAPFNLPTWLHHVPSVLVLFAALLLTLKDHLGVTRSQVVITLLAVPVLLSTAICGDGEGTLYCLSYVGTTVALISFGRRRSIQMKVFVWYFFFCVLPIFLVSQWIGPLERTVNAQDFQAIDFPPSLIPTSSNHWKVHLGPWGEHVHYSGFLGLVLCVIAGAIFIASKRYKYLVLSCLGVYLVIFSGARTAYLCLACVIGLYLVNRRRPRPKSSWLVVAAVLAVLYGADDVRKIIPPSDNEAVNALLRHDLADVTSGRQWLWSYHVNRFLENPFTGVGLTATRFRLGTHLEGGLAVAASESYYTQVFAAFGIWGLSLVAIHGYLVSKLFRSGNMIKIVCGGVIVVGTAGDSWFAALYYAIPLFVMTLVCSGLDSAYSPKGISQRR